MNSSNGSWTESFLGHVRSASRQVAEAATHVRINRESIPAYAASLPLEKAALAAHDSHCHYLGHGDATVAFFLTLDAVNFGSGYFPHLRKRPGMSGYCTVAAALRDHFQEHGPLSARELSCITAGQCTRIFDQDPDNAPIRELMQFFANALSDLGSFLLASHDGSFVGLVEAAGSSAERLVQLLIQMPYFNDVAAYGACTVPFYKRAQLTVADLAIAFDRKGPGHFRDLDSLTIFADNVVPHVLRMDGLLAYGGELAARIDEGALVSPGSPQEVEIRACAVHAVELLVDWLRGRGLGINSMGLDYILWNRGQGPSYSTPAPHMTRTVSY